MEPTPEPSLRRWAMASEIAMIAAIVLCVVLGVAVTWKTRQIDRRLIGTWQSDADRTVLLFLGPPPYDKEKSEREVKLRKLFGKMQITYTDTTYTSDFDGVVETTPYEVLGRDKVSVVIRNVSTKPSPLDILELSSFTIIRFEGADYYQVHSELGGCDEIFKRIK